MSKWRNHGTRQDRFAYKRMITGIQFYQVKKQILRFLTLTGVNNAEGYRKNFDKLRRYLRRRFGTFEYFSVRTDEGSAGVLHILYAGKAFRWGELSKWWKTLTGYWNISISSVKSFKGIGFEMTRQHKTCRYSQSRGWFQGKTKEINVWFDGTPLMGKKQVRY